MKMWALTGQPLDVVVNGSVKVARLEGDAAQLAQEVHRGQALGVEIALVSAGAVRTVAPWLHGDRALAISHCPGDTYLDDPGTLPRAFIRALVERGGVALDHAGVTGILVEDRAVAGVVTSKGRIEAPVVVDAAGAWARRVGDLLPTGWSFGEGQAPSPTCRDPTGAAGRRGPSVARR